MPEFLSPVVALTQEMVRLNTTNPPGNETPVIELLEARLLSAGFETAVVPYPVGENRSQLVARRRGSGQRPGLLFSGHVDVVPPGDIPWSVPPFSGEIRDGQLYGRGSCDMKGGVAALVVAAETLSRDGRELQGDLVVAVTADEERNCLGAEALMADTGHRELFHGLGAALVAEPTALQLYIAEKGALWVEVIFRGRTAHGSMPHLGANAVSAAAEFLYRWEQEYVTLGAEHPLLGKPTITAGAMNGGVKINVIPDSCVLQLDMRTVPPLTHAVVLQQLETLAATVCAGRPGNSWSRVLLSDRPSVSCPADSSLAAALSHAVAAEGIDPSPRGVPYCTEACIWVPELGIPAVICGPGDPGMAHQPDESVPVDQLDAAVRVYLAAGRELLC